MWCRLHHCVSNSRRPISSVLTGCETENTFDVSMWNPNGHLPHEANAGKGAQAFVMKEVSDCFQRQ